ncbi:MAG TPA: HD domain-containing protein [Solirubrobacteraceae bacterium]
MSEALELARRALTGAEAWVVGGAVRDGLLGRHTDDVDLAVRGDPGAAARALAHASRPRPAAFALSDAFGAWRVVGPGHAWQIDLTPLRGGSLEADLRLRDFTINAMAEPLGGGELVDPTGGAADLAARRLRAVADQAFTDDPLRTLRLPRLACELELVAEPGTLALARAAARGLARVAPERVFAELKRIVASPRPRAGLELAGDLELTEHVLPELGALRGVEQNRYHHADVLGHTFEVLDETVALERDPGAVLGDEHGGALTALLAEPLADEVTRATALRFGALLHDAAKPQTRATTAEGETIGFPGHDVLGAELSRAALRRLRASERLQSHVAALARHHLALGFLVHRAPLSRRDVYRYLAATEPVEVDVSLLSVADRLATRGHKADESITRHLEVARSVVGDALRWRDAGGAPRPLLRGDELARELGLAPGPELGRLLAELQEAQFAGEVRDRQEALAVARSLLARS